MTPMQLVGLDAILKEIGYQPSLRPIDLLPQDQASAMAEAFPLYWSDTLRMEGLGMLSAACLTAYSLAFTVAWDTSDTLRIRESVWVNGCVLYTVQIPLRGKRGPLPSDATLHASVARHMRNAIASTCRYASTRRVQYHVERYLDHMVCSLVEVPG